MCDLVDLYHPVAKHSHHSHGLESSVNPFPRPHSLIKNAVPKRVARTKTSFIELESSLCSNGALYLHLHSLECY